MSRLQPALAFASVLLLGIAATAHAGPITIDPVNPHYFRYNGQTIALVGASGDYLCHVSCITSPGTTCDMSPRSDGTMVITSDFVCRFESYVSYIADLKARGLNTMRLYISLNHSKGWQKNGKPYDFEEPFPWNGNKWDLTAWSAPFFNRVRAVLTEAQNQGVIVEVTLFDPFDPYFTYSPWNTNNNLQAAGWSNSAYYASFQPGETCPAIQGYSITDPDPRHKQIAILQRAAFRLNDFNNFYWEIANEPELANPPDGVSSAAATAWHDCMVRQLYSYEASQPNGHHLIGVEYHAKASLDSLINGTYPLSSPNVAVVNSHYARVANGTPDPYGAVQMIRDYNDGQFGQLGRVFGFNEGRFTPFLSRNPDRTAWSARAEAWEFMLSGGGAFDHLGYDWKNNQVAHDVRNYLGYLLGFLVNPSPNGLGPDLVNMSRDPWCGPKSNCWIRNLQSYGLGETTTCGNPAWQGSTYWAAMHSPSNYLLYQHHSQYSADSYIRYEPPATGCPSYRETTLQFRPAQSGSYRAKWIDPATGIVSCTPLGTLTAGVDYALPASHVYPYDVALWIQPGATCP